MSFGTAFVSLGGTCAPKQIMRASGCLPVERHPFDFCTSIIDDVVRLFQNDFQEFVPSNVSFLGNTDANTNAILQLKTASCEPSLKFWHDVPVQSTEPSSETLALFCDDYKRRWNRLKELLQTPRVIVCVITNVFNSSLIFTLWDELNLKKGDGTRIVLIALCVTPTNRSFPSSVHTESVLLENDFKMPVIFSSEHETGECTADFLTTVCKTCSSGIFDKV